MRTETDRLGPIDSHCHLQTLELSECERALDTAREAGVSGFLVPAIRLEDADRLLALCQGEDDVWCALGVHPHEAKGWCEEDSRHLLGLLQEPGVVAVGECGLDFHYDYAPREDQISTMRGQWEVAVEIGLPVIVHNRESNEAMRRVLAEETFASLEGVFHSFAGGSRFASELAARDFYLGMSGMITFPAADNVRAVLPQVPMDRLLVETDTPYLAPVPHRGKPNRPAYVVEVLDRLGSELGMASAEIADLTSQNFLRLFRKARSSG